MLGAIGRYFRALGYLVTGRVDAARKTLNQNPYVIQATFDRIIEEKKVRINQYKDAVARLISQQEQKMATAKSLTEEVTKLERMKEGAAAKAKLLVQQMQNAGKSMDEIKHNEEYLKCLSAFNDFSSTLKEKQDRIAELETDISAYGNQIGQHKVQLQGLLRELEKVKGEASATVADVITAKEEQEISNILAGISTDRTGKELEELRQMRADAKSKARVSKELAGTDTKMQEQEFLDYASKSASSDEFDKLIGLAGSADKQTKVADAPVPDAKLPE
jgi:chromosome segregation ATPase